VLALCPQGPLGVDIELGKRRHHPLPLARRFYAQSEYEWLCALPAQEQEGAFYRLWSRKEAVLKAHGGGIAAGLEKVRFLPEEGWRLDNRLDDTPYQVQDWPFASGWLRPDRSIIGRPVDVVTGADGSVFVTDDAEGVVYRIRYTGKGGAAKSANQQ